MADWIAAHHELADRMFSDPIRSRLEGIRSRLHTHGYSLKVDIGKRSTRATVASKTLRSRSSYPTVEDFMAFEEARLDRMDAALLARMDAALLAQAEAPSTSAGGKDA